MRRVKPGILTENKIHKEGNFIEQVLTVDEKETRDIKGAEFHYELSSLKPQISSIKTQEEILRIMEKFFDTKNLKLDYEGKPCIDCVDEIFFTYEKNHYYINLNKLQYIERDGESLLARNELIYGLNYEMIEKIQAGKRKGFTIAIPAHGLVNSYEITLLRGQLTGNKVEKDMLELLNETFSEEMVQLITKHNKKLRENKIKQDYKNLILVNKLRMEEPRVSSVSQEDVDNQREKRDQAVNVFIDSFFAFCQNHKQEIQDYLRKTQSHYYDSITPSSFAIYLYTCLDDEAYRHNFYEKTNKHDDFLKTGINSVKYYLKDVINSYIKEKIYNGYPERHSYRVFLDTKIPLFVVSDYYKNRKTFVSLDYIFKILRKDSENSYQTYRLKQTLDADYKNETANALRKDMAYQNMVQAAKILSHEERAFKKKLSLFNTEQKRIENIKERKVVKALMNMDKELDLESLSDF